MLARQRQERILEEVQRHGGARVSDLVAALGVSDMTIRRDIQELARRDLVLRVHGGATSVTGRSAEEPGFVAKSALQPVLQVGDRRRGGRAGRARCLDRAVGRHDDVRAGPAAADRARPDHRHQLTARGQPAARVAPRRHDGDPHRRRAHAVQRAGRPDRRRCPAHAARRHAVPRRARHGRAGRADHPEPGRGRDRPGHGGRRPSAGGGGRPQQVGRRRPVHDRRPRAGGRAGDRRRHRRASRTHSLATGSAADRGPGRRASRPPGDPPRAQDPW